MEKVISYLENNWNIFLERLKEFLSIPSISTLPEFKEEVRKTALWLGDIFKRLEFSRVEFVETRGYPILFAEYSPPNPELTILIYGHYDVQPVDPESEWISKPFEPEIRGDCIYARGASDMKSQILAQIFVTEAWLANESLPIRLKYIIEGEEEVGSPNIRDFLENNKDLLFADFALNCDAGIHSPDIPSITYGLRGLAYFELELKGPKKDLHSGLYGGTIRNPIHVLCELIAKMHDDKGKVTLPGFYDKVTSLTSEEKELLAQVPFSEDEWKNITGVTELYGEEGFNTLERVGIRPTLDVNGIVGGFTGKGAKTVLPSEARAKISMRLVPNQDPSDVEVSFRNFLESNCPKEISWRLALHSSAPPAVMNLHSVYMKSAEKALEREFGRKPVFKREGGSVPVVAWIKEILKMDTVMLGFSLPDDGIHGPNEHQNLSVLKRGTKVYAYFYQELLKNLGK
ncbi:MAG: dipeptidase [Candidatus Hydrogenedentes bacterium]|nr:dipeptidase [Candidatus Hydrogenedentota bacterium]